MPGFLKTSHVGFVVCCVFLAFAAPVDGATFTVNTTTDLGDSNPGDGVCSASGVFCTLRAAFEESNALGGSNRIILPEGTYVLTLDWITVFYDVDLEGAGAASCIVDGNGSSSVFRVWTLATLRASGLTVQNGMAGIVGGGFDVHASTLILEDVVVRNNSAPYTGFGAGISNQNGTVTITRSTLSGNVANREGGAIWSNGDLTVVETEITGNTADVGGGLVANGTTVLTDVIISANAANGYYSTDRWQGGGGMFSNSQTVTLERATFENNTSKIGGGIHFEGTELTITNTTFTNNGGSLGGGAIHVSDTIQHNLNLTNVTIAGNHDSGLGGGALSLGTTNTTVAIANTIIADNGSNQCDSSSQIVSFGHNLETTNTCGLNATGDQVNTPAGLATIAANGGFTRTMALQPGSAAIDAGNDIGAPTTDQRGVGRPQDGDDDGTATSDIGAFEVEQPLFADGFETGNTFMWSGWVP